MWTRDRIQTALGQGRDLMTHILEQFRDHSDMAVSGMTASRHSNNVMRAGSCLISLFHFTWQWFYSQASSLHMVAGWLHTLWNPSIEFLLLNGANKVSALLLIPLESCAHLWNNHCVQEDAMLHLVSPCPHSHPWEQSEASNSEPHGEVARWACYPWHWP